MDYTTATVVKGLARLEDWDTADDALLALLITQCSGAIDQWCRRPLYARTETHLFDYRSPTRLWLDDWLLSVTTLTNGDGTVLRDGTDFFRYPRQGPPYRWLDIRTDSGVLFQSGTTAQQCISLLGSWGFAAATLGPVGQACALWVAWHLQRTPAQGLQAERVGTDYSVTFTADADGDPPPAVRALLLPYRWRQYGQ